MAKQKKESNQRPSMEELRKNFGTHIILATPDTLASIVTRETPTEGAEVEQIKPFDNPEEQAEADAVAATAAEAKESFWLDNMDEDHDGEDIAAESVFFEKAIQDREAAESYEQRAERMAEEEEERAQAEALKPELVLQVATEVTEILTGEFLENSSKADEASKAAELARQEALQTGHALLQAHKELKEAKEEAAQAKREAIAAREEAAKAVEQTEINKRLAPKILAMEKAERIAQAQGMANVIEKLTARYGLLESILDTSDEAIVITVTGVNRANVDFTNKTICKNIAELLLEKVADAIGIKEKELNAFTV
jgi:hypothetical protein